MLASLKRLLIPLALVLPFAANAEPEIFEKRGAAIRGYDPVAYFVDGEAMRGQKEFTLDWNGATWRFASAANMDRFRENPEAYAPQFGGWCAYGMSRGYYASTDPQAWTVVDDKLYLNYSKSVKKTWLEDRDAYIAKAEGNWTRLRAAE